MKKIPVIAGICAVLIVFGGVAVMFFGKQETGTMVTVSPEGSRIMLTSLRRDGREWLAAPAELKLPKILCADSKKKKPEWQYAGSPSVSADRHTVTYRFTDETLSVDYCIRFTSGSGPVQMGAEIVNRGGSLVKVPPSPIIGFTAAAKTPLTAWRFCKESGEAEGMPGGQFGGSGIYRTEMTGDVKIRAFTNVDNTWNSNGYIPIVYFDGGDHGFYTALEWPVGQIEAAGQSGGVSVEITCAENSGCDLSVPAGATVRVPTVYLGAYTGSIEEGSNEFKRWFFKNKAPKNLRNNPDEPFTQCDDQGAQLTSDLLQNGVQSIKWDYGWWTDLPSPTDNFMKPQEGSWVLRNRGVIDYINRCGADTMEQYGKLLEEQGYNYTVYVLLHDAQDDLPDALTSVGSGGRPEWFTGTKITTGACASLADPDCLAFVKERLLSLLQTNHITTWRTDFGPIANNTYAEAAGFYELVDYLASNKPDFRLESCGSGGSLKDFATLSRATVINNDDSANYNSLRMSFYDTSYCLPSAQIMLPCNLDTFCEGSAYYSPSADAAYGIRSLMLGVPSFATWTGLDKGRYPFGVEEELFRHLRLYQQYVKPLVREADLYHILPRPDNIHWDGVEYYDPGSKNSVKGCVFLFKPSKTEGDTKTVVLQGLNPDREYTLEFLDRPEQSQKLMGRDLMDGGFDVTITGDSGSEIVWIK